MTSPARAPSTSFQPESGIRLLQWAAALTSVLVGYAVWNSSLRALGATSVSLLAIGLFGLFALIAYWNTRPAPSPWNSGVRLPLIALQYALALSLMALVDDQRLSILLVVAAGQLPWALRLRQSLVLLALVNLAVALWFALFWEVPRALIQASLYTAFQLFALFASHAAVSEGRARETVSRLNQELKATRALLSDTARQSERLRISRDLHDVAGHHLTALSLNLEIALHQTQGPAREAVGQAREIATLLLTDVRRVVEALRNEQGLDLEEALQVLVRELPGLQVELHVPSPLWVGDARQAEALLRCAQEMITNTLRHAHARHLWLRLEQRDEWLQLTAVDDG